MRRGAALLAALCCASPATAATEPARPSADPGRWVVTSSTGVSADWRQGLASDDSGNVFFSGSFAGIHRTRSLRETAANGAPIPPDVQQREQYNHIGDIAWDHGRLLLPLESYQPFQEDTNPSKTGSIGVLDPATLAWQYYVKLDPSEIAKTQWVAATADGLVWTVSGHDLLAYRLADVSAANAAPAAAPIHSVRTLPGAVPEGGAGGAGEIDGRLYMSTSAPGVDRVVSVDLATGASRVELERPDSLEPEGVDAGPYLGGTLHVELVSGLSNPTLLNLLPRGTRLALSLAPVRVRPGRAAKVRATVAARPGGVRLPIANVEVRIGKVRARTDAAGRATLKVRLARRGLYRAYARFSGLRTASARLRAT